MNIFMKKCIIKNYTLIDFIFSKKVINGGLPLKSYLRDLSTGKQYQKNYQHGSVDPQILKCDCVGPPDKTSNIRLFKYYIPDNEIQLERLFRHKKEETQEWHRRFWSSHNVKFQEEKELFIRNKLLEKYGTYKDIQIESLSAEELAEFYKSFLDKTYQLHKNYNKEWYRRNLENIYLAFRVLLQNAFKRFSLKKA